jgi:hypothetical protein
MRTTIIFVRVQYNVWRVNNGSFTLSDELLYGCQGQLNQYYRSIVTVETILVKVSK